MVNDLPFYEEAHAADTNARQDQLAKREKKCQEGMLRQTKSGSRPATNFTTRPPSKKKFVPRPAEKALDLSLSLSSPSSSSPFMGDSSNSPSIGNSLDQKLEPTMPFINLELEEEETAKNMAFRLKVGFKERHRKRFNEALPVVPPPAKKSYPEAPHEEPIPNTLVVQVPPIEAIRPDQELVVSPPAEDTCPDKDGDPAATSGGNVKEKDILTIPSIWEDIGALLKTVPCFTTSEPPASGVEEFFSFSHRHFIDLRGDPRIAGVVRLSHVPLDSTLRYTYPLLKYTAEETAEVVGFTLFLPKFA